MVNYYERACNIALNYRLRYRSISNAQQQYQTRESSCGTEITPHMCYIRTQITTVLLVLLSSLSLILPSVLSFTPSSNHRQQQTKLKMSTEIDASPQKIDGISSPLLLDNYDTFLLDMWGVMHNGSEPYEGVLQTIQELKKAGKKLIILSNSSKRREKSEAMLTKLGFNPSDFDNIITSGDVSHSLLQNSAVEVANSLGCTNWDVLSNLIQQKKQNVYVFGSGDDDEGYCTSAGWTLSSIDDADLIIARGTFTINDGTTVVSKTGDFETDKAGYWRVMEEDMAKAAKRQVPMLVCNPDKVRPDEGLPPMPGAIGDTYERFVWCEHCNDGMTEEDARGYVKRIGKPFQDVYDIALSGGDKSRTIMVGDALDTDVVGGCSTGIDVLWVINDGIHGKDVKESSADTVLGGFNSKSYDTYAYGKNVKPTYITDHFRW